MTLDLLALWLVRLVGVYAVAGLLFGLAFVARGVERVDAAAHGSTLGFRILILPAATALWPLLLRRWLAGQGAPPVERTAHRAAAGPGRPR